MTRRRLWLLTTLCCAALALPTLARLIGLVAPIDRWGAWTRDAAIRLEPQAAALLGPVRTAILHALAVADVRAHALIAQWLTPDAVAQWRAGLPMAAGIAAMVLAIGGLAILLIDRRRARRRSATPKRVRRLARRGTAASAIARRTGLAQDAVRQLLRPQSASELGPFADFLAASLDPALPPPARPPRNR